MHGGRREGSGRKAGAKQRADAAREAAIAASGLTPLDFMLNVMRSTELPTTERMEAAKAAAPFVHPRLAAVNLKGDIYQHNEEGDESASRKLLGLIERKIAERARVEGGGDE